jgi:hypothetical protein
LSEAFADRDPALLAGCRTFVALDQRERLSELVAQFIGRA